LAVFNHSLKASAKATPSQAMIRHKQYNGVIGNTSIIEAPQQPLKSSIRKSGRIEELMEAIGPPVE